MERRGIGGVLFCLIDSDADFREGREDGKLMSPAYDTYPWFRNDKTNNLRESTYGKCNWGKYVRKVRLEKVSVGKCEWGKYVCG